CSLLSRDRLGPSLFPYTTLFRSLAGGERGHVVVQHEVVGELACERVDALRVTLRAERGGHHGLRLAAREQRRAMHARQHTGADLDRKSTRLNSSHVKISYAVFCL